MSVTGKNATVTPPQVMASKGSTPLVCLTAYTTPMAKLADALGIPAEDIAAEDQTYQ